MSLISAIKDAIFTDTSSDIAINERSFISVVLDSNSNESIGKEAFRVHSYKGKSLIITRHIIHAIVTYIVLGSIWIIYGLYSFGYKIVTGRWRGMKSSSGINLIIGSTVFVAAIIILIYIMSFLIKDIVFSPNNARINNKGVITVDQPCLETHSFFLLNAATFWTSTDIQISEGDRVVISASGSMYSDVDEMCDAARSNKKLKYPRGVFAPNITMEKDTTAKYCIYGRGANDLNPQFGSLLYQICASHSGPVPYNIGGANDVQQMDFSNEDNEFSFNADKSGVLYLVFNDVLLDRETIASIEKDTKSDIYDEFMKIKMKQGDTIDRLIWFQDNLGEVLVNVKIEKDVWKSDLPRYKKPIVSMYRHISNFLKQDFFKIAAWKGIAYLFIWFLVDILVSRYFKKHIKKPSPVEKSRIFAT
ncbi:MAG: hypothetical protein K6A73_04350 [Bacteroidales bacterium]|nr:hypothetical protein [Bacteroidales bacterium]